MFRKFLPLLLLALAACDPCSGLGSCGTAQVRYQGFLSRSIGFPQGPAEGVRVRFVRTGGVKLESDTLVARSDSAGKFYFESRALEEGQVDGDLWIYPPDPIPPVRKPVHLATSRAPGEVRQFGEIRIPFPYFGYEIKLFFGANREPAVGVEARFRRTGGVPLAVPDTFTVFSDERGIIFLRPRSTTYGEVTGDLTIYPPLPYKEIHFPNFTMKSFVVDRADSTIMVQLGPRLPYSIIFVWSDTGQGAEGVEVEFDRTGGIPVSPERLVTRSDRFGTVHIDPAPLRSGEVVGDLVVRPPAPGRGFTVHDFRLSTVDDNRDYMLLGYWAITRGGTQ